MSLFESFVCSDATPFKETVILVVVPIAASRCQSLPKHTDMTDACDVGGLSQFVVDLCMFPCALRVLWVRFEGALGALCSVRLSEVLRTSQKYA